MRPGADGTNGMSTWLLLLRDNIILLETASSVANWRCFDKTIYSIFYVSRHNKNDLQFKIESNKISPLKKILTVHRRNFRDREGRCDLISWYAAGEKKNSPFLVVYTVLLLPRWTRHFGKKNWVDPGAPAPPCAPT